MLQCQKILAIPQRRHTRPTVGYLFKEGLAEILAQPDLRNRGGRRDAVLLSILYDTGASSGVDRSFGRRRTIGSTRAGAPYGKGTQDARCTFEKTIQLLRDHMHENHLDRPEQFDRPLFHNGCDQRLSRSGIRYILQKHAGKARSKRASLNRTVMPHMLRHTKGMHLLQSGISPEMIRDFLGHVDVKTTQIYARANLEMKRIALERISDSSPVRAIPSWQQNNNLLEWLRSL
jgi:site-specific recombinase XerD